MFIQNMNVLSLETSCIQMAARLHNIFLLACYWWKLLILTSTYKVPICPCWTRVFKVPSVWSFRSWPFDILGERGPWFVLYLCISFTEIIRENTGMLLPHVSPNTHPIAQTHHPTRPLKKEKKEKTWSLEKNSWTQGVVKE